MQPVNLGGANEENIFFKLRLLKRQETGDFKMGGYIGDDHDHIHIGCIICVVSMTVHDEIDEAHRRALPGTYHTLQSHSI